MAGRCEWCDAAPATTQAVAPEWCVRILEGRSKVRRVVRTVTAEQLANVVQWGRLTEMSGFPLENQLALAVCMVCKARINEDPRDLTVKPRSRLKKRASKSPPDELQLELAVA